MDRRQLLGLLGATAVTAARAAGSGAASREGPPGHVVVVGAGILGVTIAYQLARRGARVTILEKTAPASGATGDSFAYLNASTKRPRDYFALNLEGMAGWRRLQRELQGVLPLQWGGAVYWRDSPAATAELFAGFDQCQQWGYAGRRLAEPALRELLPRVAPGRVDGAVFYEQEGAVDPAGAVRVILARAQELGVRLEFPVAAQGLEVSGRRVRGVRTSEGRIEADAVVVAAGLGSQSLVNLLGLKLPLQASVGVLVHTEPQSPQLQRVAFGPAATIKQDPGGRIVASSGHEGAGLTGDLRAQGAQILGAASRYFPSLAGARIERVSIGNRVLPADGLPILGLAGQYQNLYLAVTHSGVTLAPMIADVVARELLDGVAVEALAPYRPSRFA